LQNALAKVLLEREREGEGVVTNLDRQTTDGPEEPFAMKLRVVRKSREVKLMLSRGFDAPQTIEQMADLLHPAGYYERIILDFSKASRVEPSELYRLFAELSQRPDFHYIEICIEGLEFGYDKGKPKFLEN
jgi:hypothetical protein